jgi:hypothetical protein
LPVLRPHSWRGSILPACLTDCRQQLQRAGSNGRGHRTPLDGLKKICHAESSGFQGLSPTEAKRDTPRRTVWHRLCIRGEMFATKSRERAAVMAALPSPGTGRATRADAGSKSDKRLSPSRGLADLSPAVGTSHSFPHSTPAIPVTPPTPGGVASFMNAERGARNQNHGGSGKLPRGEFLGDSLRDTFLLTNDRTYIYI